MNSNIRMVEIATGHISNRSQVALVSEKGDYVFQPEDKTESYHSWYEFDEQLKQYIDSVGSIQGYNGSYYIDRIILDFDKKALDNDQLLESFKYFVNQRLMNDIGIPSDHFQIWFSGTGFHVEMCDYFGFTPSTTLPSVVRETLTNVFEECDSIYDGARLIRANWSYNAKGCTFKIPVSLEALNKLSIKEIITSSAKGKALGDYPYPDPLKDLEFDTFLSKHIVYPKLKNDKITVRSEFQTDPNSIVTCMQTVLGQNAPVGERNETMMRLASWMRRSGIPKMIVQNTIGQWSGLDKEAEEITNHIWTHGYQYGCNDHIMSKYCKPECIYFKHKDYSLHIESAKSLAKKFSDFINTDFSESAFNFADIYDVKDYWVFPGELVVITGDTGLGKSTFCQNLATKLPKLSCLFLSLENSYHLTYRRFAQITHSLEKKEIIDECRNAYPDVPPYDEAFKHIHIVCSSPEINKLRESIGQSRPKLVIVDTTDMIFVKGIYDEFTKMNEVINTLKDIAQNQECIIIAVHHVNKESMRDGISTITSLKGSTNVVQKADKVLALNGSINETQRSIHSLKARDEGFMRMMFNFHKPTMQFEQILDSEGFGV